MALARDSDRRDDTAQAAAGEQPGVQARARNYWLALAGLIVLAGYFGSGLFAVDVDEQAVIRRFGAVAARVGPGMHYRLPWPIDRVDVLKTTSVIKAGVGFALPEAEQDVAVGMELMTGDTNILSIAMVLQYIIDKPADFLFRTEQPQNLIGLLAESALTETLVGLPVDEVLTTGRLAIQEQVKAKTQAMLDGYHSGIRVTSANIMTIALDPSVAEAFQDVADAMADREKSRNTARAYANNLIPKARGEAHSLVLAAQSFRQQRTAEAVGDADSFLALLGAYRKAPDITRTRLYIEALEKVLPKVTMYIIDTEHGRVPFNLRVTKP